MKNRAAILAMMAAAMSSGVETHELKGEVRPRKVKKKPIPKGLKKFTFMGIDVYALNQKNAENLIFCRQQKIELIENKKFKIEKKQRKINLEIPRHFK